jgi:hypothetical protein
MSTPRGGRVALIVVGALVATFATAILAFAGLLHWAASQSDDDGYYTTDPVRFAADGHAISSSDLEVDEGVLALTGEDGLRVHVRSRTGAPVFVGVGPSTDVEGYLADVPHAVLTDVDLGPFRPTYRVLGGRRTPAPPAREGFWTASAEGEGEQTLSWDPDRGSWAVALMNADGSAGIATDVDAGAKIDYIDEIGWSSLGTGTGLALIAGTLLLVAFRPRRRGGAIGEPVPVA